MRDTCWWQPLSVFLCLWRGGSNGGDIIPTHNVITVHTWASKHEKQLLLSSTFNAKQPDQLPPCIVRNGP